MPIRRTLCFATLVALALTGCAEDPFLVEWSENPRESVIYALDRDERDRPSGFDLWSSSRVVIESPQADGRWDFVLDRQDGELVLIPPRTLGVSSDAGIAPIAGVEYDEVRQAPADTASYSTSEPVPVELGTIYVIRTREQPGAFGQRCNYFGKVEPLEVDAVEGVLRFLFDVSPDCNNRSLTPPN